eukprot:CAMPEP_0197833446 /NCGR_PEP_ID=MMETSP1437-20131217/19074_1 /TAXON_ID=49252 ORGANISM="Eucampia antarctica, Strain CCMP1452" /NCGR_SAMPLE_ID=MMETSP1437 /ASSEMBLY_ACC=CAM_ASM_001096 /LENGTH=745 /DNA_ID=CAMNT_0043437515 /DNA_START=131 /DNA_END=2368 /DNA_ORIENTATION=+
MVSRKENQSTGGNVMRKREIVMRGRGVFRLKIMVALIAWCVFRSIFYNGFKLGNITEEFLVSLSESLPVSNILKMTKLLESSTIRYYVYDDDKLVLSHIRAKALEDAPKTWRYKWGLRYSEYAKGEIRWIEALERHPQRTRDPCEADFFVVPIPVGAAVLWGQPQLLRDAFETLLNGALFQQHPERHVVAFATTERVFGGEFWGNFEVMKKFQSSIIVRDSNRNDEARNFGHVVSLGYGGEGSNPSYPYNPVTTESWNKKQFWYFYHTRREPSDSNSTQYRQFFLRNSTRLESFEHQPVSIGFDIPLGEWVRKFSDSKFCLTIRGDQPGSRSLNRAIRVGCIPLIISDALPVFQSLYSKTLQYDDFALIVKEEDFLKDPIGSLDKAISLSPTELLQKLEGLRLMQRIVTADQSDSLFVPAFAREIVETMKENGFAAGATGSQCNIDHNAMKKREIERVSVVSSTDAKMLSCLKQILLNRELPIIPQLSVNSNGTPRTALNGKRKEVPFLGAQFAHHGDTGDYKRWNKSIQMARASHMPQLEHGTEKLPCIVLEIGAHREAKSSQDHIKKYPNCEYHAYEVIPQFAEELKERWKDEPRMHVHPYGLAENDMEIKVHINALNGVSTFVGDLVTSKNLDEKTTVTGQIRAFDFALSEIGQLHNREADAVIPTLLDINCEGCEYDLLLEAKKHGFIERVPVVLIGWHAYGEDGVGARAWQLCQVRAMLSETHEMAYGLGFGWERWVLRA